MQMVSRNKSFVQHIHVTCQGRLNTARKMIQGKGFNGMSVTYYLLARLGVLVEVNCETDFVARGEKFRALCQDMAMQIASNADVVAVSVDDIPERIKEKEREIEMGKDDILSKPENRR